MKPNDVENETIIFTKAIFRINSAASGEFYNGLPGGIKSILPYHACAMLDQKQGDPRPVSHTVLKQLMKRLKSNEINKNMFELLKNLSLAQWAIALFVTVIVISTVIEIVRLYVKMPSSKKKPKEIKKIVKTRGKPTLKKKN